MREGVALAGVVEAIMCASVEGAEELLRAGGWCPPPTVHMLSRHLASPYIGSVATRPFYRGADAEVAVMALGLLPSLLCATQLVVVWEYADLCRALELPGLGPFPNALVVIDAGLRSHMMGWHPFELRVGPSGPIRAPEWGTPATYPDAPLPSPVAELLTVWREWRPGDVRAEGRALEAAGFRVSWAQRP